MAKQRSEFKEFAIIGARLRVQELQAEINRIKKQFGARVLSGQSGGGTRAAQTGGQDVGNGLVRSGRKRRKMSAAARKRISDAQKARWAKQKAGKK